MSFGTHGLIYDVDVSWSNPWQTAVLQSTSNNGPSVLFGNHTMDGLRVSLETRWSGYQLANTFLVHAAIAIIIATIVITCAAVGFDNLGTFVPIEEIVGGERFSWARIAAW